MGALSTGNRRVFHRIIQRHMGVPSQWIVGLALGIGAAVVGYLIGGLTPAGAVAAAGVGTVTMGGGGLAPALLLLLFFFSSSALSRLGNERKARAQTFFSKQARRDEAQVLANGAMAAGFSLLYGLTGAWVWFAGLSGALAAVTADTWATELGVLSSERPRLITTCEPVEAGTSGGVSLLGTAAAAGGALLLGLAAAALGGNWRVLPAAACGGLVGAFVDSLLGATVQASYLCPACNKPTERHPRHTCGAPTVQTRGWSWMNNDPVNFAASLVGALVAMSVWLVAR
jgi:uncharacterized protein (TIGR00297 family)